MPVPSCFTPTGMLDCSSRPTHAEDLYFAIQQMMSASPYANDQAFDFQVGEHLEAWVYATAMGLARHLYMLEHAGNQSHPHAQRALDLLPLLELDYMLVPGPRDDYIARQKAVMLAQLMSQGYRPGNVVAQLKSLLGSAFLSFVPHPAITTYPTSPGGGGPLSVTGGSFQNIQTPIKFLQLSESVAAGVAWVGYQNLDPSVSPVAIGPGDAIVVDAGNSATCETLTVSSASFVPPPGSNAYANLPPASALPWVSGAAYAVGQYVTPTSANANGFWFKATTAGISGGTEPSWPTQFGVQVPDGSVNWVSAGASTVFLAFFTRPHSAGAPIVAGNFPAWWSTRRLSYVVVTAAASVDSPTRAKIDALMAKLTRGVSDWAIVAGTPVGGISGGLVGALQAASPIGTVPIGSFPYTNS